MGKCGNNKVEEFIDMAKSYDFHEIKELLNKISRQKEEEKKKSNVALWIFAVIGAIAAVAGIAYAVYRYLTPDYLEDFEDDFDDDFEDDMDDDDSMAPDDAFEE